MGPTRLDQLAPFAQQKQPLLVVDPDQNQTAGGIKHKGLDDRQPLLAAFGAEPGQKLGRIAARGPGGVRPGSSVEESFKCVRGSGEAEG